jgi:hypothetical protein
MDRHKKTIECTYFPVPSLIVWMIQKNNPNKFTSHDEEHEYIMSEYEKHYKSDEIVTHGIEPSAGMP